MQEIFKTIQKENLAVILKSMDCILSPLNMAYHLLLELNGSESEQRNWMLQQYQKYRFVMFGGFAYNSAGGNCILQ